MSLETGLYAFLAAEAGVKALVAARIYPDAAPAGAAKPYIVYQRITTERDRTMDGPNGLAMPRMQVTCWAATYIGAKVLADAVADAIDGFSGDMGGEAVQVVSVLDEGDMPDLSPEGETGRAYGRRLDLEIWHCGT